MKKELQITVEAGSACGKSSTAWAIADMFKSHGVECSISGCEDEYEGVMEREWSERFRAITSGDIAVKIVTKQKRFQTAEA